MQSAAVCFNLSSTYQIRNIIAGRGISRHSLAQKYRLFIIREYAQFGSAGLQQQETPPFDRISQIHSIKDIVPKSGQWVVFQSRKIVLLFFTKKIVLEAGAPPTTEVTGLRA
jgi:hypothetical protein